MQSAIYIPENPQLQKVIEYFWTLTSDRGEYCRCEILPPETRFEVLLSFDSPTVWTTREEHKFDIKSSFLCGMRKEPYIMKSRGPVDYLAIRFYPQGLYHFMDIPPAEINDARIIDLDALQGRFWKDLTEKIALTPGYPARIRRLEAELLTLLATRQQSRSWLLENALAFMQNETTLESLQPVYNKFHIYPKLLEREFQKYIGVTPKFYSRLLRFNRVLYYLNRGNTDILWADLACRFGYFDQSHFIREFTAFTLYTPEQFKTIYSKSAETTNI